MGSHQPSVQYPGVQVSNIPVSRCPVSSIQVSRCPVSCIQVSRMKIVCIAVYQADLPLVDGDYCWADGKSVSVYDSTVVAVTTDSGITGYGEVVPLGPNYL